MSKDSLRLPDYLDHILEAIQRIDTYCADVDEVEFLANQMLQDAVIRNFEVIGEASHNILKLNSEFLQQHPDVPLLFAYEMRNALAHGYHKVDLEIVWSTVNRHLADLKEQISTIKAQLCWRRSNIDHLVNFRSASTHLLFKSGNRAPSNLAAWR